MAGSAVEQVRKEIGSVIDTAEGVAYEGLQPGSDGPKVLAGLILQLAAQVDRLAGVLGAAPPAEATPGGSSSPNGFETATEEDASPGHAPAEPRREI